MTDLTDLTEFLLARIADDERLARAATAGVWILDGPHGIHHAYNVAVDGTDEEGYGPELVNGDREGDGQLVLNDAAHIVRWDPPHVLAECEAKRRVVSYADTMAKLDRSPALDRSADAWVVLRSLAVAYADHLDYDPAWAVG